MGTLKNKTTRSQNDKLLEYLRENKSITTFEAFDRLKIFRISARIGDLRGRGYHIDTIIHREMEDGVPKVWGEYILRETA